MATRKKWRTQNIASCQRELELVLKPVIRGSPPRQAARGEADDTKSNANPIATSNMPGAA